MNDYTDQQQNISQPAASEFRLLVEQARARCGKEKLSNEELLILACEAVSKTYTYEEKGYR